MPSKIRTVIGNLTQANPDYRHPFLVEREPKSVGIIVISTDRGLCGGLNANVFRARCWPACASGRRKGASVNLCLIGTKGSAFFRRLGLPILAQRHRPRRPAAREGPDRPVKVMLDAYREGRIDRLFLVNAQFVNTMTQKPRGQQLLPVETADDGRAAGALGLHLRARRRRDPRRRC